MKNRSFFAVDVDQAENLAHEFAAAEPSMPTSLAVELAHLSRASGIAGGALQMQVVSSFEVSDAYQCIFVPLQTSQTPVLATGGHAPGHYYSYVFCHGTDLSTATTIFREMLIRPTVPGSGLGANCDASARRRGRLQLFLFITVKDSGRMLT